MNRFGVALESVLAVWLSRNAQFYFNEFHLGQLFINKNENRSLYEGERVFNADNDLTTVGLNDSIQHKPSHIFPVLVIYYLPAHIHTTHSIDQLAENAPF